MGAVAVAVVGAGAAVALVGSSDGSGADRPSLPPPRDPAFVVGKPPTLNSAHTSEWASVAGAAVARRAPAASAAAVARVPALTPEGTGNIVQILGRRLRSGRCGSTFACRRAPRASTDGCRARR